MYKLLLVSIFLVFHEVANSQSLPSFQQNEAAKTAFFIANKGQWPNEVLYMAKLKGHTAWITKNGLVSDFHTRNIEGEQVGHVVEMSIQNSNVAHGYAALEVLGTTTNFYLGNSQRISNVRSFSEVIIPEVQPNIDLRYYFENGGLRYDFIVRKGGNPSSISIKLNGTVAAAKVNKSNDLIVPLLIGNAVHTGLEAFQKDEKKKVPVSCQFVTKAHGSYGFKVGSYDTNLSLIIDPLIYGSFLGGSTDDACKAMTVNRFGQMLVTGSTLSINYPTTVGAYSTAKNVGSDAFVTLLNASGTGIVYSTYIGGSGSDEGTAIAINSNGQIGIAGNTTSTNFPTSAGAYDNIANGGSDGFIIWLDGSGQLMNSTYLGGSGDDYITSFISGSNATSVAGYTSSPNFPTMISAFSANRPGGEDGFVSKLSPNLSTLLQSSYLGTAGAERIHSMANDTSGNYWLAGTTASSAFPTTSNGLYSTYGGGATDAFIVKLDSTLSTLGYGSFLGGSNTESEPHMAINGQQEIIITGGTLSPNFPTSAGSYTNAFATGSSNVFVAKIAATGTSLLHSGLLAGNAIARGIASDGAGNTYVTGSTGNMNFPSVSPFNANYSGGNSDAFVAKIDLNGAQLMFSTFLGGNGDDEGIALAPDGLGNVYVAGTTKSASFPVAAGAFQSTLGGSADVFTVKMLVNGCPALNFITSTGPSQLCEGLPLTFNATGASNLQWRAPNGSTVHSPVYYLDSVLLADGGPYYVSGYNSNGCFGEDTLNLVVNPRPTPNASVITDTLFTGNFNTYQWYKNGASLFPEGQFSFYTPRNAATENGDYYVIVTNSFGCAGRSNTVTVRGLSVGSQQLNGGIKIYPNPSSGSVRVEAQNGERLLVYNALGSLVRNAIFVSGMEVDLIASGLYVVKLLDGNGLLVGMGKVMVVK